ncbi:GNAT family N-acetyltransferase [Desertihabitans aurantiacus]|uniref:GNAT family N-acetyltransferase n=1 Tax=Desertihabitans aurantiacus TaxID=2282477 RepID=UPI001E5BA085|nr:GNAT family N-acetyltransferase [Desertihabitans aurantiacus]
MLTIRRYRAADAPTVWALNDIPHRGDTEDPSVPLRLQPLFCPPPAFPDLADIHATFIAAGGDFLVAELAGDLVGMAGFRANERGQAQVLRVRVHPAVRRQRVGARLMGAVERRALELGFTEAFLDTSTHQPAAMAFYQALGYREVGRETRPEWSWTLAYLTKQLGSTRATTR